MPARSTLDMTDAIEGQIERFAPGFRDVVLARHIADSSWYEAYNPNIIGGDIAGRLARRAPARCCGPAPGVRPYRTPNPRLFLCSASTPPGGGVHGMCGYNAAQAALAGRVALTPAP